MQDDKTLDLICGDTLATDGVAALRKQRDDLRLEVERLQARVKELEAERDRQYDALHGMHGDYQQTWLEKDGRIAELGRVMKLSVAFIDDEAMVNMICNAIARGDVGGKET